MFESQVPWCEIARCFVESLLIVFLHPCVHCRAQLALTVPGKTNKLPFCEPRKVPQNRRLMDKALSRPAC